MKPSRWGYALQISFIGTCLFMGFRGEPPAYAQERMLSGEDLVQDSNIRRLQDTEDKDDVRMSKMMDSLSANTNAISGIQGEERGLAVLLGLLQIGSFVFQVKKNGKTS